jgi:hypothetical protein
MEAIERVAKQRGCSSAALLFEDCMQVMNTGYVGL